MHTIVRTFCLALGLMAPSLAHPASLMVTDADPVQPNPELLATVAALRAVAATAKKANIKKVEGFFASKVSVFQRGLDPFQPWNKGADLTRNYLSGVADAMIEQGELAAGMKVPDYRLQAMRQIADLIPEGGTFGTLAEAPGSICAPARYEVDQAAAAAFARRFDLNAYSLRFFSEDVRLELRPGSAAAALLVPARTLLMFNFDPTAPEGSGYYETSDQINGYMPDREDSLGLSQNHICFSKVKGKYRISAVFGYGL